MAGQNTGQGGKGGTGKASPAALGNDREIFSKRFKKKKAERGEELKKRATYFPNSPRSRNGR